MEESPLRYDVWIEDALRSVIRNALSQVAREGLPGDHHFYITFRTEDPGVVVPPYLRAQHPEEMTIVIQHQFDNLHTNRDAFEITLYFKGKGERLRVPFRAITAFSDPSVNFGLQLKTILAGEEIDPDLGNPASEGDAENDGGAPSENALADADEAGDEEKQGKVVALDAFRKK